MSEMNFEELLAKMPEVAKAVNTFNSESVQQQAFAALLESLGVQTLPPASDEEHEEKKHKRRRKQGAGVRKGKKKDISAKSRKKTSAKRKHGPSIVKDLNLHPKGKVSLKDFVSQKVLNSDEKRFAVIVYYLEKKLGLEGITPDHIYTCFKDLVWKVPRDLKQAMFSMANRRGWIDTSESSNIKMAIPGENLVEHDLVAKEKEEKKKGK